MHRRRTSHRVCILDSRVAGLVTGHNGRAVEQSAQICSTLGLNLDGVSDSVNPQRRGGPSPATLHGERCDHVGLPDKALGILKGEAEHRKDRVGPVGQRQPFLLDQNDRLKTARSKRLSGRLPSIFEEDVALTPGEPAAP